MRCLICSAPLQPTWWDPEREQTRMLVCGKHSEQHLSSLDLEPVWAGLSPHTLAMISTAVTSRRVMRGWTNAVQDENLYSLVLQLDDDALLVICCFGAAVAAARFPKAVRSETAPEGMAEVSAAPRPNTAPRGPDGDDMSWMREAVAGAWRIADLKLVEPLGLQLGFVESGQACFSTELVALNAGVGPVEHALRVAWTPLERVRL